MKFTKKISMAVAALALVAPLALSNVNGNAQTAPAKAKRIVRVAHHYHYHHAYYVRSHNGRYVYKMRNGRRVYWWSARLWRIDQRNYRAELRHTERAHQIALNAATKRYHINSRINRINYHRNYRGINRAYNREERNLSDYIHTL